MRPDGPLGVVLVDDHRMFVEGLGMMLGQDRRLDVLGIASSSSEASDLVKRVMPDVVLLDVDIDDQPADRTIRQLLRGDPSLCIVMLTMHTYQPLLDSLIRAGARACVNKNLTADDLVRAVLEIAANPGFGRRESDSAPPDCHHVTHRELEVLRLVNMAKSNRQIAQELGISEGTVKRHLHEANVKLVAVNRLDAVRKAEMLGLLDHSSFERVARSS
ncbi:response regulator transcription factor [Microbacterium mangrovi]|uniref:response regulator transcription factor n=1 Tax=Microbacterium mangrovi TaxID=1348253 RepID=UPI00068C0EE4|nr:response regulator transcription factor [Microbacterium mangrovi]